MKYADLHIHTSYSDGTYPPEEILAIAKKSGLSCISVTDHDTTEGLSFFTFQNEIEFLSGIELTADSNNAEIHILGYLIDYKEDWFQKKLQDIRDGRVSRMKEMCGKLTDLGLPISLEEVLALAGRSLSVGRLHLARVMVKKGLVANLTEAFTMYIGDNCPAYVSRFRLNPRQVIELILQVKGVPVLAHPYILNNQDLIPQLVEYGLKGIEAVYPEHSPSQIKKYQALAEKLGLLVTGGSDFHGEAKPNVKMGLARVPYELVEKLKSAKI